MRISGIQYIPASPFPEPARLPPPYVNPHQARTRAPTDYENLVCDALESAFAAGVWELEPLVARLNAEGVRAPDGSHWSVASFQSTIARLGE